MSADHTFARAGERAEGRLSAVSSGRARGDEERCVGTGSEGNGRGSEGEGRFGVDKGKALLRLPSRLRANSPLPRTQAFFDKKYGPTWHCIVGSDFRAYVTHESKHFIFFYVGLFYANKGKF